MSKLGMSTLLGLIIGVGFIFGSLFSSGHAELFWNLPSAFIIMGGTAGSLIMAYPPKRLKTLGAVIKRSFKKDKFDIIADINTIVKFSELARREGLLSLEGIVDDYTQDEFIKRGIQLIVDGSSEEELRYALSGATHFMKKRHQKGAAMVDMIAATAPALGLLGTYVGLIPMLNNLDDPTTLGPMMALELVSSFYGAFIAYVVFSPLAKRLKNMSEEEVSRREVLIEGLAALQVGKNPRRIKEELLAMVNIDANELDKKEQKDKLGAGEVVNGYEN